MRKLKGCVKFITFLKMVFSKILKEDDSLIRSHCISPMFLKNIKTKQNFLLDLEYACNLVYI